MSLLQSASAAPFAPPPSGGSIRVTDSYTLPADQTLVLDGGVGFKLEVKHDSDVSLDIEGEVMMKGHQEAMYGIVSTRSVNGDASVTIGPDGSFSMTKLDGGIGALADLSANHVSFTNRGELHLSAPQAEAVGGLIQGQFVTVSNSGSLEVTGESFAYGYLIYAGAGSFTNDGSISATGSMALGFGVSGAHAVNTGTVTVVGTDTDHYAVGASFSPLPPELSSPSAPVPAVTFENSGEITASGLGLVVGVTLQDLQGFTNSGRIVAEGTGEGAKVIGLGFTSDGGVMQNDGVIKGDFALMAGDAAGGTGGVINTDVTNDIVINSGKLLGDIMMGGGSDGVSSTGRIVGDVDMGDGGDIYIGNRGHLQGIVEGGGGDDYLMAGGDNDSLYGDYQGVSGGGDDVLRGMKGDDALHGNDGADTLLGGQGADTLEGGAGDDVFRFAKLVDSGPAAADLISDLEATDVIDLHRIDADTGAGGDQAFHLVGSFTGSAGELTVSYDAGADLTTISGDVDGDGSADLVITASGDRQAFTNFIL